MRSLITPIAGLIWAGLSLGGNLIAAPAKFQVPDLTYQTLLQIGRAQFAWLANTEWLFLAVFCAGFVFLPRRLIAVCSLPIGLFLIQRLWIMPALNDRTTQIISGQPVPDSNLHLAFIGLETLKFILLATLGVVVLRQMLKMRIGSATT